MNTLANWCDAVFVINLAKRQDRWTEALGELDKLHLHFGWEPAQVHRFEAYGDLRVEEVSGRAPVNGNMGCTASHRGVLEVIAFHQYERALVLEDDFMLRPAMAEAFPQLFHQVTSELPRDWRMLYLGGSYGENPKRRHSPHLIETNAVMTTSSYLIHWRQARAMAPHVHGLGPIDSIYHRFNREGGCFMTQPRFFVQRPSYSDLQERLAENVTSMEDEAHEDMLLEGTWLTPWPEGLTPGRFAGKVQRRELTSPGQLHGTRVIVDGREYVVSTAIPAAHYPPRPWFRGEPCTYILRLP